MKHSEWIDVYTRPPLGRLFATSDRTYVVFGHRSGWYPYKYTQALVCPVEHVQSLMYGVWGPYNEESDQHREAPAAPVCCHVAVDTGFKRSWCKSCGVDMVFDAWDWKVEA